MQRLVLILLIGACFGLESLPAKAAIHSAPVIVHGFKIRYATRYPIKSYRLFKTGPKGEAIPIPFQIDELNEYGDYVLDKGKQPNIKSGNGVFDLKDELVFMGDDVGPVQEPKTWPGRRPTLVYEVRHSFRGRDKPEVSEGAVYIGIYFANAPPLSKKSYVIFDKAKGEVRTSRYHYKFDKDNYLVVRGVDMVGQDEQMVPLINASTFYLRADMKYFLTVEVDHSDFTSYLEAFKVGPIRTIVRVTFLYKFLKINFELGMYTEVSLFSNSVVLPAIMYNPLDGGKSLNVGSGFYYGFAVRENPSDLNIETNIPAYKKPEKSLLDFFKQQPKYEKNYWVSMTKEDRMMFFEVVPSREMLKAGNIPMFYQEDIPGDQLMKDRGKQSAKPLGKSPVNLGLFFDLSKFAEGEHRMSFQLFFDNKYSPEVMKSYRTLRDWSLRLKRL